MLNLVKSSPRPLDRDEKFSLGESLTVEKLYTNIRFYLNTFCYTQSKKTIESKRAVFDLFLHFIEWKGIDNCDRIAVAEFLSHAKHGHLEPEGRWGKGKESKRYYKPSKPRTVQLYYIYLKHFFKIMEEEGIIESSPMSRMERPKVPEEDLIAPTPQDVEKLINEAAKGKTPLRDLAIIRLAYDTGVRLNELSSIRYGDINLENSTVFIQNGKRSKRRLCRFGPETAKTLLRYMRTLETLKLNEDDLIFLCFWGRNRGQPLQPQGIYQIVKRHAKSADIRNVKISPHMLRHAYAVERMVGGLPPRVVQGQMGHGAYEQTLKYSRAADQRIAEMTDIFNKSSPVENLKKLKS